MLGYLSVFSLSALAFGTDPSQDYHSDYAAFVSDDLGLGDGESAEDVFPLDGISRVIVRVYDSSNSGSDATMNITGFRYSSGGVYYDTPTLNLDTAGDNLGANHIDTFWYDAEGSGSMYTYYLSGYDENPTDDGGDWFQADTTVLTYPYTYGGTSAIVSKGYGRDDFRAGSNTWSYATGASSVPVDVYALLLTVADESGAGTDEKVYARLTWADETQSDWLRLDNPWLDDFERGESSLFFLPVDDNGLGDPVDVEIQHKATAWGDLLVLSAMKLVVETPDSDAMGLSVRTIFDVDKVLSIGQSCTDYVGFGYCYSSLSAVSRTHALTTQTGTRGHASTDSILYARVVMSDGRATAFERIELPGDTFEERSVETFPLQVPAFWLSSLELSVAAVEVLNGEHDGWRPRSIDLVDEDTAGVAVDCAFSGDYFTIDQDCDSSVTDDCAPAVQINADCSLSRP